MSYEQEPMIQSQQTQLPQGLQHFDTGTTGEQQEAQPYQFWCRNYSCTKTLAQEAQLRQNFAAGTHV